VPLAGGVEILLERATAAGGRPRLRIDDDLPHQAQVGGEAPIADAVTGDAVYPATDRNRKIRLACKSESRHDVADIERASDQLRVPFDHPVERCARFIEATVVHADDRPSMAFSQLRQRVDDPEP
jgi:hypothetical protein